MNQAEQDYLRAAAVLAEHRASGKPIAGWFIGHDVYQRLCTVVPDVVMDLRGRPCFNRLHGVYVLGISNNEREVLEVLEPLEDD